MDDTTFVKALGEAVRTDDAEEMKFLLASHLYGALMQNFDSKI